MLRCPTRQEADSINVARLNRLKGLQFNFPAKDMPGVDEEFTPYPPYKVNAALGRLVAPKDITLKVCSYQFRYDVFGDVTYQDADWCTRHAH